MFYIKIIFVLIKIIFISYITKNQGKIIKIKNYIKKALPFFIKALIISFLITISYNFYDNIFIVIL